MIAYKGFNKDLRSTYGNGKDKDCNFTPGETKKAPGAKTAREGFHCTENPFECLGWHPLGGESRYWKVEAHGDIDEGKDCQIACTEITLLKELDMCDLAYEGMKYIIEHPRRTGWEQSRKLLQVQKDYAEAEPGGIAIARGLHPRAAGPKGSILGILQENEDGIIIYAKMRWVKAEWECLTKGIIIADEKEVKTP